MVVSGYKMHHNGFPIPTFVSTRGVVVSKNMSSWIISARVTDWNLSSMWDGNWFQPLVPCIVICASAYILYEIRTHDLLWWITDSIQYPSELQAVYTVPHPTDEEYWSRTCWIRIEIKNNKFGRFSKTCLLILTKHCDMVPISHHSLIRLKTNPHLHYHHILCVRTFNLWQWTKYIFTGHKSSRKKCNP